MLSGDRTSVKIEYKAIDPSSNIKSERISLLPCKIQMDGQANVSKYMIEIDKKTTLRGRELHGEDLKLPEHYKFVVLQKEDGKDWTMKGKQSEITVWTRDEPPSTRNCGPMNVNSWIKLADAIHS
jgi:hypothetical protein